VYADSVLWLRRRGVTKRPDVSARIDDSGALAHPFRQPERSGSPHIAKIFPIDPAARRLKPAQALHEEGARRERFLRRRATRS